MDGAFLGAVREVVAVWRRIVASLSGGGLTFDWRAAQGRESDDSVTHVSGQSSWLAFAAVV